MEVPKLTSETIELLNQCQWRKLKNKVKAKKLMAKIIWQGEKVLARVENNGDVKILDSSISVTQTREKTKP